MLKTNTLGAVAAAAGALVAVGLVILVVLVVDVQLAEATFPGKNGNIAFSSLDGTDFEIYTIPPTGGTPSRLTNNGVYDSRPAYSPDGTKIAFISDRDGNEEIYMMDAAVRDGNGNGDSPTRLTNNAALDQDPAYSPDGTRIAFETLRDGNEEIYVMDAADRDGDGNGDNLTRLTNNATGDSDPSSSPDGTKIAFETLRDGNKEIYMMDAADRDGDGNGDNPIRLTSNAAVEANPSFSPDGTKIAFISDRDGNEEIYMMDAADRDGNGNGDSPARLTNNAVTDQNPSCSPDGTKIAFETFQDSNKEIYMMDAADRDGDGNGDNPTRLTSNAATDRYPDWGSHADTTPPKVMTTSPASNAIGVARTSNVTATFSEDMMVSSISGQTFKLVKLNADGTTTRITAAVSYVAATMKAKLEPATSLTLGATYMATVTSGAQDLQNNALDQNPNIEGNQNKSWKFTVR